MKQEMNASTKEAFYNQELREKYFSAVKFAFKYADFDSLCGFKQEYPEQFRFFQKVHRLRSEIAKDVNAMKLVSDKVYFGTLTFDNAHDKNKIETKRKDAFEKLKSIFKYVLLVEEFGGVNGRYHLHFIAAFTKDHNFDSFKSVWHSRQNLKEVNDDKVSRYLVSYVAKDLPRLRRNKYLVALRKKVATIERQEYMIRVHKTPIDKLERAFGDLLDFEEWVDMVTVKKSC